MSDSKLDPCNEAFEASLVNPIVSDDCPDPPEEARRHWAVAWHAALEWKSKQETPPCSGLNITGVVRRLLRQVLACGVVPDGSRALIVYQPLAEEIRVALERLEKEAAEGAGNPDPSDCDTKGDHVYEQGQCTGCARTREEIENEEKQPDVPAIFSKLKELFTERMTHYGSLPARTGVNHAEAFDEAICIPRNANHDHHETNQS